MKLTVWMAQNKRGEFLCYDNKNLGLSYHLSFPYDCGYLSHGRWVMCSTKWEVEEHVRKFNKELRCDRVISKVNPIIDRTRCRAVKMVVSWEPYDEGGAK